jgi:hypothetical protein
MVEIFLLLLIAVLNFMLKNYLKNDSKDKEESKDRILSDMYKEDYQYSKAYDLLIGISIHQGSK